MRALVFGALGLAMFTGASAAWSQQRKVPTRAVTPSASVASTAASSAPEVQARVVQPASTAMTEVETRADALLRSMQRRAQEVALILRVARQRDDKKATACANDALNRANMSVRLGREKVANITGLMRINAADEAGRNVRLLEELSSNQAHTTDVAGACIGQVSRTVVEKTEIKVEKPAAPAR